MRRLRQFQRPMPEIAHIVSRERRIDSPFPQTFAPEIDQTASGQSTLQRLAERSGNRAAVQWVRRERASQSAVQRQGAVVRRLSPESADEEAHQEYITGKALYDADDYTGALAHWNPIYQLPELTDERRQGLTLLIGICHQRLNHLPLAIQMLQEAASFPGVSDSDRQGILERIRQARGGLSSKEEVGADKDNQIGAELTPEQRAEANERAHKEWTLGHTAYAGGKYEEALPHFQAAYHIGAVDPDKRWQILNIMAMCYMKMKKPNDAISVWEEMLIYSEVPADTRESTLNNIRKARTGLTDPQKDLPGKPLSDDEQHERYKQGKELYDKADYAGALAVFRELYLLPNARPDIRSGMLLLMGTCEQRMENYDKAIEYFQEQLRYPDLSDADRHETLERIRQARTGEQGTNVTAYMSADPEQGGPPVIWMYGMAYFDTGKSELNDLGQASLRTIANLIGQRHRRSPEQQFRIDLYGSSSRRYRGAGSSDAADKLNAALATARTQAVASYLNEQLESEDALNACAVIPISQGSDPSREQNLDADDNSWRQRAVSVTVNALIPAPSLTGVMD